MILQFGLFGFLSEFSRFKTKSFSSFQMHMTKGSLEVISSVAYVPQQVCIALQFVYLSLGTPNEVCLNTVRQPSTQKQVITFLDLKVLSSSESSFSLNCKFKD